MRHRIPLRDGTIHAVTIGFGIRNVERAGDACREILRVLRPGGTLVILEFSLPRSPVLRNFYLWYFREILPRDRAAHFEASECLHVSASSRWKRFRRRSSFPRQLRDAGFGTVRAVPLTFGVVYLFVAVKDAPRRPGDIID